MLWMVFLDGIFKIMGVVVNGIIIGELFVLEVLFVYGKGLCLLVLVKIEVCLLYDGIFDEVKVVVCVGNGWF